MPKRGTARLGGYAAASSRGAPAPKAAAQAEQQPRPSSPIPVAATGSAGAAAAAEDDFTQFVLDQMAEMLVTTQDDVDVVVRTYAFARNVEGSIRGPLADLVRTTQVNALELLRMLSTFEILQDFRQGVLHFLRRHGSSVNVRLTAALCSILTHGRHFQLGDPPMEMNDMQRLMGEYMIAGAQKIRRLLNEEGGYDIPMDITFCVRLNALRAPPPATPEAFTPFAGEGQRLSETSVTTEERGRTGGGSAPADSCRFDRVGGGSATTPQDTPSTTRLQMEVAELMKDYEANRSKQELIFDNIEQLQREGMRVLRALKKQGHSVDQASEDVEGAPEDDSCEQESEGDDAGTSSQDGGAVDDDKEVAALKLQLEIKERDWEIHFFLIKKLEAENAELKEQNESLCKSVAELAQVKREKQMWYEQVEKLEVELAKLREENERLKSRQGFLERITAPA
jgi:hypothetical protein